jgi:PAS domain S-box-containing protein
MLTGYPPKRNWPCDNVRMPSNDVSEIHEQMARLSQAGRTDEEIAAKLHMTAKELGEQWSELEASLKVVTQDESVEIVLARLLVKARDALKQENAHFAMVVGSAKEQAVITFGSNGLITAVSHDCEKFLGKSAAQLIGQPMEGILAGNSAQIAESADEMHRAELGTAVQSERSHIRDSGETFMAHHTLVALIGPTGDTAGFVRTIRDLKWRRVHEIKVAELEQTIAVLLDE